MRNFGLKYLSMADKRQDIIHIIRLEQGFTLLGMTYVGRDSHTVTHGAFGVMTFVMSMLKVERVLATSTLIQVKS